MEKKVVILSLILLVTLIVITGSMPKPGPMAKLTLVNRMVTQSGSIYLKGLTNFYTYNLTARAYAVDVHSAEGPVGRSKDDSARNLKTEVTTYVVRQDMYEITISACGFTMGGMLNLHGDSQIVFPSCDRGAYGQQMEIDRRSVCVPDPTLPLCRKQGFVLTTKGSRGEEKNIKVKRPPLVTGQ